MESWWWRRELCFWLSSENLAERHLAELTFGRLASRRWCHCWYWIIFFEVLASHMPELDGLDQHFQATVHFPLTRAANQPQQHQYFFFKKLSWMLGIEPRAAGWEVSMQPPQTLNWFKFLTLSSVIAVPSFEPGSAKWEARTALGSHLLNLASWRKVTPEYDFGCKYARLAQQRKLTML